MVDRRQGAVRELREDKAELMVGSTWAEEVWNGGATVSLSSPECRWAVAVFWGFGAGKWRVSEGIGLRGVPRC